MTSNTSFLKNLQILFFKYREWKETY